MEITARALWTLIHGMLFGALYLLACSGALVGLYRVTTPSAPRASSPGQERFIRVYLITMAVVAWAAVLTGTYVIYPWYRAAPPAGTTDLSMFPANGAGAAAIVSAAAGCFALAVPSSVTSRPSSRASFSPSIVSNRVWSAQIQRMFGIARPSAPLGRCIISTCGS